jgi:hypothetical protein
MNLFEKELSISEEDIALSLREFKEICWGEFWLNPRRLRGSNFLMRWSQGEWSEQRIIDMINSTNKFTAVPYGPSGVAPSDIKSYELYFERLDKAGLGKIKRPDLLIFNKHDKKLVNDLIKEFGGVTELPFVKESNLQKIIQKAIIAVECENSLWKAEKMPDFNSKLTQQKRLKGKLGLKKTAVVPTIIIKEEDRTPLKKWQTKNKKPIHIWHVFFDRAYGIALNNAERLIRKKFILPTTQVFQAPGGATTKKDIYKLYYHYAYPLATSKELPQLEPDYIEDKNGHILPYVKFKGGSLKICNELLSILASLQ